MNGNLRLFDKGKAFCYTGSMEKAVKNRPYSVFWRIVLIIAGGLLIADTLFVLTRCYVNLGVIMPAVIGAPLLLIGLFLPLFVKLSRKSRLFRAAAFLVSLAYLLFGVLFAVTTGLMLISSASPAPNADAVIVLGSGIRGDHPSLTLKYRLDAALDYLKESPDSLVIVSGGQGPDEIVSEASVMKKYLVSHGVDPGRVIEEERSESTQENFEFSKAIVDERLGSGARVVFVTTRFHVFRAERVAAKLGISAEGVPAKGVWYITLNDYLRECAAITAYLLRGDI